MADEQTAWTDENREDLRDTLRMFAAGEVRFGRMPPSEIIEHYREVFIEDDAPEDEWSDFVSFGNTEVDQRLAELDREKSDWPKVTDCDRLDAAEASLLEVGIVLWQASPCCDTCTGAELPDRIDHLETTHPGVRERVRGYAFFIDQSMAETLAEGPEISLYLAYGYFSDERLDQESYKQRALEIGHEVVEHLQREGLEVAWDGDFSKKILLNVRWLRRNPLN